MSNFKPTGKCDVCNAHETKYWFGQTASAICGSITCSEKMEKRFKEHCEEMEKEFKFEREMKEMYGGDL